MNTLGMQEVGENPSVLFLRGALNRHPRKENEGDDLACVGNCATKKRWKLQKDALFLERADSRERWR